jgi:hypothetical protein
VKKAVVHWQNVIKMSVIAASAVLALVPWILEQIETIFFIMLQEPS